MAAGCSTVRNVSDNISCCLFTVWQEHKPCVYNMAPQGGGLEGSGRRWTKVSWAESVSWAEESSTGSFFGNLPAQSIWKTAVQNLCVSPLPTKTVRLMQCNPWILNLYIFVIWMITIYLATQESNILKIFVTYMLAWGLFFLGFYVVWNLKQHVSGLPCEIMIRSCHFWNQIHMEVQKVNIQRGWHFSFCLARNYVAAKSVRQQRVKANMLTRPAVMWL